MTGQGPEDDERGTGQGPEDDDHVTGQRSTDEFDGGLPSASSIFGEAKLPEDWPTRRAIRAAERAARESGEVESVPDADADADAGASEAVEADTDAGASDAAADDDRTQALSMPEELAERADLAVPPPAAVPPTSTAPHPMSIELPSAASTREDRAAETRAIDEERRRTDPDGVGRDDVDWLGRATPTAAESEPPSFTDLLRIDGAAHEPGAEDATANRAADAPFDWSATDRGATDGAPAEHTHAPEHDATPSVHTSSLAVGGWSLADEDDAESEVVDGEQRPGTLPQETAAPASDAEPSLEELLGVAPIDAADDDWDDDDESGAPAPVPDLPPEIIAAAEPVRVVDVDDPKTDLHELTADLPGAGPDDGSDAHSDASDPASGTASDLVEPTGESSWSLSDDAARTGEVFVGDTMDTRPDDVRGPAEADPVPTPEPQTPTTPGTGSPTAASPDDIDQREWDGRETSDTRAIDALFGTGALQAVDHTDHVAGDGTSTGTAAGAQPPVHDYLDDDDDDDDDEATGTRMMPVVGQPSADAPRTGGAQDVRRPDGFPFPAAPVSAGPGPVDARPVVPPRSTGVYGAPAPARTDRGDNFVNEGFGRLAAQGQRGKRLLIWGAVGLIVVLLVLVFFLTRWIIGGDPQNQPAPSPTKTSASASLQRSASPAPSASSASPEPAATASFAATPAAPGEHSWRDLAGGECVNPFTDAWATSVTVVDCAGEHPAQLTHRGTIDQADYPGADSLRAQMATTCSSSGALDASAAGRYSDIQVQGSYPADIADWNAGDRYYYCFVSRASGQAITGSLAPAT